MWLTLPYWVVTVSPASFEVLASVLPRPLQSVMPSQTYQLFRRAILEEKQVVRVYHGRTRELCPLILGHSDGVEKVLAFQFGGESTQGRLPPGGEWRCLFLSDVREARLQDGPWHEGLEHRKTQSCVKDVDLDINIHVRKLR